jgi:hypothetical protein
MVDQMTRKTNYIAAVRVFFDNGACASMFRVVSQCESRSVVPILSERH